MQAPSGASATRDTFCSQMGKAVEKKVCIQINAWDEPEPAQYMPGQQDKLQHVTMGMCVHCFQLYITDGNPALDTNTVLTY